MPRHLQLRIEKNNLIHPTSPMVALRDDNGIGNSASAVVIDEDMDR